jgi:hypothetical protein
MSVLLELFYELTQTSRREGHRWTNIVSFTLQEFAVTTATKLSHRGRP